MPLHAKGLDNYYVESNGVIVEFNDDTSLAMLKHIKRGERFNSWYIYQVNIGPDGKLYLTGLGEVKDDMRGTTILAKEKPADIIISGIGTDDTKMTGLFNSPMRATHEGGFNYHQWELARSLDDYDKYPEQYSADSVANLTKNAYALVNSYKDVTELRSRDNRQLVNSVKAKRESDNAWPCALCIIPFVIGFVLYQINIGGSASGYLSSLKWFAINCIIGGVLIPISVVSFDTHWWLIVLAVMAILGIQVTNIFSILNLRDCVINKLQENFPKWPAIIFGYVSMICLYAILCGIAVFALPGVDPDSSIGERIGGLVATVIILIGIGIWYRNCIARQSPSLKKYFIPVAIMTTFCAIAILCLIVVIIAFFIFKATGKAFLNEGSSEPSTSLVPSQDPMRSCNHCGRLGDISCPHFKKEGSPGSSCSSWIPD